MKANATLFHLNWDLPHTKSRMDAKFGFSEKFLMAVKDCFAAGDYIPVLGGEVEVERNRASLREWAEKVWVASNSYECNWFETGKYPGAMKVLAPDRSTCVGDVLVFEAPELGEPVRLACASFGWEVME